MGVSATTVIAKPPETGNPRPVSKTKGEMSNDTLLSIIAAHEKAAMGNSSAAGMTIAPNVPTNMTTLELDNYNALNYYYARPLGNEQPDRSQVVDPVLRDTVEWAMPQLMKMFAGTDRICRFEPDGEQDEALAEQQTDGVNYIFMQQNDGFMVLHDYIKDALLLRNGYTKSYWEVKRHVKIESYTGLDEDALTQLFDDAKEQGDKIEILGQEEKQELMQNPLFGMPQPPPQPGQPPALPRPPMIPYTCYDIKIRRTSEQGQVCVDCVPREEVLVSPRTRQGLDNSPYYCHKDKLSRSILKSQGYDGDLVDAAQPGPPRWTNLDDLARNTLLDQTQEDEGIDPANQELEIRECYLQVDFDQDGIAELRRVVVIGDKIADNEEVEEGPLASGSPMRMPHRHTGISLYELLVDLQQIKTMLTRQLLDNGYLANNMRTAVDQDAVNFEDLLTVRPGGVVRTKGTPSDKIMPLVTPDVMQATLAAIGYFEEQTQYRTGIGKDSQTLDPDELQNVTKGNATALLAKSAEKLDMMARLLAEGLKDTFRKINNIIIRHQDKEMMIKLRGKWVKIDPSSWKYRAQVSVNVGLGSGNQDEKRQNLMLLGQAMQVGAQAGIVGPKQMYNAAKRTAEVLGFQQPEEFFVDPASPEGQQLAKSKQPPPPWQLQAAQMKLQASTQEAQGKAQAEAQQSQLDHSLEQQQMASQQRMETAKILMEQRAEAQKMMMDASLKERGQTLQFVIDLAMAALKAQADAAQIQTDVQASERALNGT